MLALSLDLSGACPGIDEAPATLVVLGLTAGQAAPGDTLVATLSNGIPIQSYAWGSIPDGTDYGAAAMMVVPPEANNGFLFLTVTTASGAFSTVIGIAGSVFLNVIEAGFGKIGVSSLVPPSALPSLTASAGTAEILVETA